MVNERKIVGVVLAGGRSSRMGSDKAMFKFRNKPLVEHVIDLLSQAGVDRVLVSGDIPGYNSIPDSVNYAGPARAIVNVLEVLDDVDAVLFVPVDMPLLSPEMLRILMEQPEGAYFDCSPLPACIPMMQDYPAADAVHALLASLGVPPVTLPVQFAGMMRNANTPEEWEEVLRA